MLKFYDDDSPVRSPDRVTPHDLAVLAVDYGREPVEYHVHVEGGQCRQLRELQRNDVSLHEYWYCWRVS